MTPQDLDALRVEAARAPSIVALARRMGYCARYIGRVARKHGIELPRYVRPPAKRRKSRALIGPRRRPACVDRIAEEAESGRHRTLAALAAAAGVSPATVRMHARRHSIELPKGGRWGGEHPRLDRLVEELAGGRHHTIGALARAIGTRPAYVRAMGAQHGLSLPRGQVRTCDLAEVDAAWASGARTRDEVARIVGMGPQTLTRAYKKAGRTPPWTSAKRTQ